MHHASPTGLRVLLALAVTLASAPCTSAQNVLIVDQNQGPGTSFSDIQSAVDAALPGDHILVRPATYAGFTVSKPVSVVGTAGTALLQPNAQGDAISVTDLPPDSDLVIRGIQVFGLLGGGGITVRNCQGRVLLDELLQFVGAGVNAIEDCTQVMVNRCQLQGKNTVTRSTVTLSEGFCSGSGDLVTPPPGLVVTDSEVFIAGTTIGGGWWFSAPSAVGLRMVNSQVTLTGDDNTVATGFRVTGPRSAIDGTGTLILDPDVVLLTALGAAPTAPSIQVRTEQVPSLAARGGVMGGETTVELHSQPGDSFVLFAGSPGNAMSIPAHRGTSWIDAESSVLVAAGTLDATGTFILMVTTPPVIELAGEPVMWLGAAGSSTLRLSNNVGHGHGF